MTSRENQELDQGTAFSGRLLNFWTWRVGANCSLKVLVKYVTVLRGSLFVALSGCWCWLGWGLGGGEGGCERF